MRFVAHKKRVGGFDVECVWVWARLGIFSVAFLIPTNFESTLRLSFDMKIKERNQADAEREENKTETIWCHFWENFLLIEVKPFWDDDDTQKS